MFLLIISISFFIFFSVSIYNRDCTSKFFLSERKVQSCIYRIVSNIQHCKDMNYFLYSIVINSIFDGN